MKSNNPFSDVIIDRKEIFGLNLCIETKKPGGYISLEKYLSGLINKPFKPMAPGIAV